jgi:hypothetical protein
MGDLWADEGFGGGGFGTEGFGDEDDWDEGGESMEADLEEGFDDLSDVESGDADVDQEDES